MDSGWQALVDRGGTFTDVVVVGPDGRRRVAKFLSGDPVGIARAISSLLDGDGPLEAVDMGTTVATNALLERRGERCALATTRGFGDALVIGTQQRPELFSLRVERTPPLFERAIEVDERVLPDGSVETPLDETAARRELERARADGFDSLAVVLLHSVVNDSHERRLAALARDVGFSHVSVSHEVAPEVGLVARGDTTVVDAALTPLLTRHVARLADELPEGARLRFMTSVGGLVPPDAFRGRDAILSGPAGGVVAAAAVAESAGCAQAVAFDMGGTSTDVSRWAAGEGADRVTERRVGGVLLRTPMVDVVTVAAGGGSILASDGRRFTVGPESAGAEPGPAAHGRGGPPTVTDANVVLGRVRPELLPRCFGPDGASPLDADAARRALAGPADEARLDAVEAASGFLRIANESMASAIREVSVARGRDVRDHALVAFGGAGPQHACAIAELLGIRTVLVHPLAGVMSAWGMGLADSVRRESFAVARDLDESVLPEIAARIEDVEEDLRSRLRTDGIAADRISLRVTLDLRSIGVEETLEVPFAREADDAAAVRSAFERRHRALFGFVKHEWPIEIVTARVEAHGAASDAARHGASEDAAAERRAGAARAPEPTDRVRVVFDSLDDRGLRRPVEHETPVFRRGALEQGRRVEGPALVADSASTCVVEPGWFAEVLAGGTLQLAATGERPAERTPTESDPVRLELFAGAFSSIAEQMGETLRRVAHSTNVKERLDYSCAVFTRDGRLVANAPHQPVHLGAMGETVRELLRARGVEGMRPGLVLCSNDPHRGGSHLPDVTVVTPVHVGDELAFFVANRGHHADVGGTRPGSMPAASSTLEEEGVVLHDLTLVEDGELREAAIRAVLESGPWPVRDVSERLSDLRSQVASNAIGVRRLVELVERHGLEVVHAFMGHVIADGAAATREALGRLPDGRRRFEDALDDGTPIVVNVTVEGGRARFDFEGTGAQHPGNLNAPRAVTRAAVLFVLRSLVDRPIPLNEGCLEPVEIVVPEGTILSPRPPAAVAGGNVETSQRIVDVVLGALDVVAASQGTMNNLTFGDATFGHYETIGGGAGAGPTWDGCDGIHTHLTNTRLTDAEVLERRHPVLVREIAFRRGSGGAGAHRGGDGLRRVLEMRSDVSLSLLAQRRTRRPYGLHGGGDGAAGRDHVIRAAGGTEPLDPRGDGVREVELAAGDRVVIETPGGGGWGRSD